MPKQRTPEEQREYMRAYRARKRKEMVEAPGKLLVELAKEIPGGNVHVAELIAERDMLREEVHRLKLELAKAKRPSRGNPDFLGPDIPVNAIAGPQTATPRGVSSTYAPEQLSKAAFASRGRGKKR